MHIQLPCNISLADLYQVFIVQHRQQLHQYLEVICAQVAFELIFLRHFVPLLTILVENHFCVLVLRKQQSRLPLHQYHGLFVLTAYSCFYPVTISGYIVTTSGYNFNR